VLAAVLRDVPDRVERPLRLPGLAEVLGRRGTERLWNRCRRIPTAAALSLAPGAMGERAMSTISGIVAIRKAVGTNWTAVSTVPSSPSASLLKDARSSSDPLIQRAVSSGAISLSTRNASLGLSSRTERRCGGGLGTPAPAA